MSNLKNQLTRISTLTDQEIREIENDMEGYAVSDLMQEVLLLEGKLQNIERELSHLDSEYARLSYELHSKYTIVQSNTMRLSGLKGKLDLRGVKLQESINKEIALLQRKYIDSRLT